MAPFEVTLIVSSPDGNAAAQKTSTLRQQLKHFEDVIAIKNVESEGDQDGRYEAKAEPITLAAIGIAFLTSGAAKAVIEAIRAIHNGSRDANIEYLLKSPKGSIRIKASNLSSRQVDELIKEINGLNKH